MARGRGALLVAAGLAAMAMVLSAGCGGDSVAGGATVRVYVGADLCAEAKQGLAAVGGKAGDLELEAVCLRPLEAGGRLDLATIGTDARRATEDSSTIAYIESRSPANRFAQPIVEEAGIAWTLASSGSQAMLRVLRAVDEADTGSSSLRDEVRKTLEAE